MGKTYRPYKRLKIKDNTVECYRESRRVNVQRCRYCHHRVGGGAKQVFCDIVVKDKTFRERYT